MRMCPQRQSPTPQACAGSAHIWEYDAAINKLRPTAIEMGKLVRNFHTLCVSADDSHLFAGSQSGDLLQVNLHRNVLKCTGPAKALPGGVTASAASPSLGGVLVGTGKGLVGLVACPPQVRSAWTGFRLATRNSRN